MNWHSKRRVSAFPITLPTKANYPQKEIAVDGLLVGVSLIVGADADCC
jgi:hypothetical protein